jgi:hypothetical protein
MTVLGPNDPLRIVIGNRKIRRVGVDVSFSDLMSEIVSNLGRPRNVSATPMAVNSRMVDEFEDPTEPLTIYDDHGCGA